MTDITFYGGVEEIGGNKIILSSDGHRIMLDWGMSFRAENEFFEEFLQPRTNSILHDFLRLGLIPPIDGIYRDDMITDEFAKEVIDDEKIVTELWDADIRSYEEYLSEENRPYVEGVLLSHAHADHSAYIGLLDENIRLHTSETTKDLLKLLDEIGTRGISKEVFSPRKMYLDQDTRGMTPGAHRIEKEKVRRDIIPHEDREEFDVGGFIVQLFTVDHSIPGASSFLITTPDDKIIAYTGDIRFHGRYSDRSHAFVNDLSDRDVDVLITEGTRIEEEEPDDEEKVLKDMIDLIEETEGSVFVGFSWKDLTRYETVLNAARETGRTFVISPKTAYLCKHLQGICENEINDPEEEDSVKVYLSRKRSMLYSPADYKWDKYSAGYDADWAEEVDLTHIENGIKAPEITDDPSKYIVFLDYYNINELLDFGKMEGSKYIRAQSEPFNEEMELNEERLCNWLRKFKINEENKNRPYQVHASGHASGPEIVEMIEKIDPGTVIPVHTESPEIFEKYFSDKAIDVTLPEYGKDIEI